MPLISRIPLVQDVVLLITAIVAAKQPDVIVLRDIALVALKDMR